MIDHSAMSDYMAHGYCFSWEPGLVWLHVASDILNGVAYYLIAAAMAYYFYKRRDMPFIWVFVLFILFIAACGTTHFFAAYTVYRPDYWPEGYVKAFTAVVSIVAAIVFIPKIPQAITMPSLAKSLTEVQRLNAELERNKERLQCVVNVLQYDAKDKQDLLDFALNEALKMTLSLYGYIYFYDEGKRQFTLNSWSHDVMHDCSVANPENRYDLEKTGIWGEAVRQRKAIMVNDFSAPDPLKRGYPDGHVALTRFLTIPLFEQGRIVAVVGVANKKEPYDDADVMQLTLLMDSVWKVVERKRIELELAHQSALLRSIIDSIPDLIFYKDTNSVYLGCNKAFERFAGRSEQEQVGKSDFDFFAPEVANSFRKMDCKMLEEGQSRSNEEWVSYPDGHQILLDTLKTPFWGADGTLLGLVGISRDITERKRVEDERKVILLRQQGINLLQQSLIAAAPLESKLKSVTDSIVRLFDADFCRIWLIQTGDLCEQGCIHAEKLEEPHVCHYRDRCLHLLASSGRYTHTDGKVHRRVPFGCYKIGCIASGEEHKFICNDVQNDPRIHDREWARNLGLDSFAGYQLRIPDGNVIGVLALFSKYRISTDEDALLDGLGSAVALVIQQSVADEARKKKEQEIEDKNAELERFTYTVSHDMKSPLVTIKTFLGYLVEDMKLPDNPRIQQDLGFMNTAADKMSQLLDELLELSRVGRVNNSPQEVTFMQLAQEAVQLDAGRISTRGVTVDIADSPVVLFGDRSRLVEIWQNLVENACKFMGDQEHPRIEIGVEGCGREILFFVRDNGVGIDPRFHSKVFGLFEKLEAGSEGTGLGLALVKRIVELHKGSIRVESAGEGQGATILFTLPAAIKA